MCIFTGTVDAVETTKIFARCVGGQQLLAYEMRLSNSEDVAMVLPLPVVGSGEDACEFVNLEYAPQLFMQLRNLFPVARGYGAPQAAGAPPLKVHDVGSFEASYVPTVRAFDRLDRRFQLNADVWNALPRFADFGFAVFQLKAGSRDLHPMGLKFATRHPERAFFPTVHVHDKQVRREAAFDHELFCQTAGPAPHSAAGPDLRWIGSTVAASHTLKYQSSGLVGDGQVFKATVVGMHTNEDIVVRV